MIVIPFYARNLSVYRIGCIRGFWNQCPNGHWVDWIHMLNIELCVNAYYILDFPIKGTMSHSVAWLYLWNRFLFAPGENKNRSKLFHSKAVWWINGFLGGYLQGEGLLRGTWVIPAAAVPKNITSAWGTTQKTCITRVPWTTCTFLYRGRIASSPPIAYYLYNYLPSFMRLTAEVNFSKKKIHKKPIS